MSYYVINKGANIYEAAAGLGATVRSVPFAHNSVTYLPLRGFGATMEYDGAAMWSAQNACNTAWQTSKTVVPACAQWVNATRAALARLGYGQLTQNAVWGPSDQAATKLFASDNGLAVPSNGYPTQAIHAKIQANLSAPEGPVETGPEEPIDVVKGPGNEWSYVGPVGKQTGKMEGGGLSTAKLALIGVGLVGIAAVAIAVKKRGARKAPAGVAIMQPLPSPAKA